MKLKDGLTIGISMLALILSGYTAYHQFFPSVQVAFYSSYTGAYPRGNQRYAPYTDIAFTNMGNTPGIIISLALYLVDPAGKCDQIPDTNWTRFVVDDKEAVSSAFAVK